MAGVTYGLWSLRPLLALTAGLAVYGAGLAALRAFAPEERAILVGILPERWRRRRIG
jgi:hypothetical protein